MVIRLRNFLFIAVILSVPTSGCISLNDVIYLASQPRYKKVKDSNKPIKCNTYSVVPPQGEGWSFMKKDDSIIFLKKYNSYHTLIIAIQPVIIKEKPDITDEYLEKISSNLGTADKEGRFKNLERTFHKDKTFEKFCLKYHVKSEDHKVPVETPRGYLIIQDDGYILHSIGDKYFNIVCSERYDPQDKDPKVPDMFSQFVVGIKFYK